MTTRLFLITLLSFIFSGYNSFSQFGGTANVKDITAIKSRQVIIQLEEEDPKVIKKLSKDAGAVEKYKAELARINEALKTEVLKRWTFSANPITKTASEVKALEDQKSKEYAVVAFNWYQADHNMKTLSMKRYTNDNPKVIPCLFVAKIEEFDLRQAVIFQNLPNFLPTTGDLVLGVQMVQNLMTARLEGKKRKDVIDEVKENSAVLKTKTLLIDKLDLAKGLTPALIKKNYAYAFEVVDYSTIEKAILEGDKRYAYVQILPLTAGVVANAHVIIEAENGKAVGYYAPIQVTTTIGNHNSAGRITQNDLKNYTKYSE